MHVEKNGRIFFSWPPPYFVKWREVLLSPVKMFQCSKLPCLGWRSADFLQGFFAQDVCKSSSNIHVLHSIKISMKLSKYQRGPRGPFLTSPLRANFDPRGEVVPQRWIRPLGVKLSPGGEILCSPLHSSKQYRVFTPGGERRGELHP
jgi:hypothetical protein